MGNLAFLNEQSTVALINSAYEQKRQPRQRLGLSQAGHECKRFLWYTHQGFVGSKPDGRVLRLFQLGNVIEDQVIADLSIAGCQVFHQQREVMFTQDGVELVGHIDGIVKGLVESPETPHLFENKSASKKKFDELLKAGSYGKWNPIYYWQTQFYMLGLKLKRAAAFVYCKDDSRLYMERIKLDRDATIKRLQRVFEAITAPMEPERLCKRADHYESKWCPHYERCFGITTKTEQVVFPWK